MGDLRLKEAVAMALGGMIGGGIYSAFGVVVALAGRVAWLAFLLAGTVAMCAGYSYVKLNEHVDARGGAPSFIREVVGNSTLAGMTGWTLLFGYVGSMALYAYAFSSFFTEMVGRLHVAGLPLANVVSVLLIAAFVGLNLVGAAVTGKAEDVLTFFKVAVIGAFGVWGVWYAFNGHTLSFGFSQLGFSPLLAAAMSFVAFQGWQLLLYSQGQFRNPTGSVRKAIYVSIPVATLLYVLVAFTTVSLLEVPVIAVAPEVSLFYAALEFMGWAGALVIGLSALFSTASAVNATLFSSALFSRDLIEMGLLPARFGSGTGDGDADADADDDGGERVAADGQGRGDGDGAENGGGGNGDGDSEEGGDVPGRIVVVLGALSAAFAIYGSLRSITSFASLAFIAVFGGMSYLALANRDEMDVFAPIPAVGLVGCVVFFPLLLYSLYLNDPPTFYLVLLIGAVVVGVELLYFEREPVEEAIPWMGHG